MPREAKIDSIVHGKRNTAWGVIEDTFINEDSTGTPGPDNIPAGITNGPVIEVSRGGTSGVDRIGLLFISLPDTPPDAGKIIALDLQLSCIFKNNDVEDEDILAIRRLDNLKSWGRELSSWKNRIETEHISDAARDMNATWDDSTYELTTALNGGDDDKFTDAAQTGQYITYITGRALRKGDPVIIRLNPAPGAEQNDIEWGSTFTLALQFGRNDFLSGARVIELGFLSRYATIEQIIDLDSSIVDPQTAYPTVAITYQLKEPEFNDVTGEVDAFLEEPSTLFPNDDTAYPSFLLDPKTDTQVRFERYVFGLYNDSVKELTKGDFGINNEPFTEEVEVETFFDLATGAVFSSTGTIDSEVTTELGFFKRATLFPVLWAIETTLVITQGINKGRWAFAANGFTIGFVLAAATKYAAVTTATTTRAMTSSKPLQRIKIHRDVGDSGNSATLRLFYRAYEDIPNLVQQLLWEDITIDDSNPTQETGVEIGELVHVEVLIGATTTERIRLTAARTGELVCGILGGFIGPAFISVNRENIVEMVPANIRIDTRAEVNQVVEDINQVAVGTDGLGQTNFLRENAKAVYDPGGGNETTLVFGTSPDGDYHYDDADNIVTEAAGPSNLGVAPLDFNGGAGEDIRVSYSHLDLTSTKEELESVPDAVIPLTDQLYFRMWRQQRNTDLDQPLRGNELAVDPTVPAPGTGAALTARTFDGVNTDAGDTGETMEVGVRFARQPPSMTHVDFAFFEGIAPTSNEFRNIFRRILLAKAEADGADLELLGQFVYTQDGTFESLYRFFDSNTGFAWPWAAADVDTTSTVVISTTPPTALLEVTPRVVRIGKEVSIDGRLSGTGAGNVTITEFKSRAWAQDFSLDGGSVADPLTSHPNSGLSPIRKHTYLKTEIGTTLPKVVRLELEVTDSETNTATVDTEILVTDNIAINLYDAMVGQCPTLARVTGVPESQMREHTRLKASPDGDALVDQGAAGITASVAGTIAGVGMLDLLELLRQFQREQTLIEVPVFEQNEDSPQLFRILRGVLTGALGTPHEAGDRDVKWTSEMFVEVDFVGDEDGLADITFKCGDDLPGVGLGDMTEDDGSTLLAVGDLAEIRESSDASLVLTFAIGDGTATAGQFDTLKNLEMAKDYFIRVYDDSSITVGVTKFGDTESFKPLRPGTVNIRGVSTLILTS